jgi:tetratricopeptide (TPR) repeat protein
MNGHRKVTMIGAMLLVALFAGSIVSRRQVEKIRGNQATLDEVLYLPSGKTVKRLSLGYSSLLADIYWTRAVQYFGARHMEEPARYELLAPLLEITTDLDPQLIVAYENGSIFLCQKPPDGAGEPDKAVALVEKGIRANPSYWRLYFTLGFIHYVDRHDYKAAQEAFQKGSEVPGALSWMRVMAARMAEHADDPTTAAYLWKTIYETTKEKEIRDTAEKHLISLRVELELEGLLRGVPADPNGIPYKLRLDGTVQVADAKKYIYLERHGKPLNK